MGNIGQILANQGAERRLRMEQEFLRRQQERELERLEAEAAKLYAPVIEQQMGDLPATGPSGMPLRTEMPVGRDPTTQELHRRMIESSMRLGQPQAGMQMAANLYNTDETRAGAFDREVFAQTAAGQRNAADITAQNFRSLIGEGYQPGMLPGGQGYEHLGSSPAARAGINRDLMGAMAERSRAVAEDARGGKFRAETSVKQRELEAGDYLTRSVRDQMPPERLAYQGPGSPLRVQNRAVTGLPADPEKARGILALATQPQRVIESEIADQESLNTQREILANRRMVQSLIDRAMLEPNVEYKLAMADAARSRGMFDEARAAYTDVLRGIETSTAPAKERKAAADAIRVELENLSTETLLPGKIEQQRATLDRTRAETAGIQSRTRGTDIQNAIAEATKEATIASAQERFRKLMKQNEILESEEMMARAEAAVAADYFQAKLDNVKEGTETSRLQNERMRKLLPYLRDPAVASALGPILQTYLDAEDDEARENAMDLLRVFEPQVGDIIGVQETPGWFGATNYELAPGRAGGGPMGLTSGNDPRMRESR